MAVLTEPAARAPGSGLEPKGTAREGGARAGKAAVGRRRRGGAAVAGCGPESLPVSPRAWAIADPISPREADAGGFDEPLHRTDRERRPLRAGRGAGASPRRWLLPVRRGGARRFAPMIGGLHWTAWLLLFGAFVPSLTLVTAFYLRHRRKGGGA